MASFVAAHFSPSTLVLARVAKLPGLYHKAGLWLLFIALYSLAATVWATPLVSQPLVIRNVTLMDAQGVKADVVVNLKLADDSLTIVSKDELPVDDRTQVINAQGGFLLGKLVVGEPVTFLIFSIDPRIDQSILLDTKSTAMLAVLKGAVKSNQFPVEIEKSTAALAANSAETQAPDRGWLAYTPPPIEWH
jgi:hypothetical protein